MKHCTRVILSILTLGFLSAGMNTYANTTNQIPTVVTSNTTNFDQEISKLHHNRREAGVHLSATSSYSTCRLIVKAKKSNIDFSSYPVEKIVVGPKHLYALLVKDVQTAKSVAYSLNQRSDIKYAEPDYPVRTAETGNYAMKLSKASWTWGADPLGADFFSENLSKAAIATAIKVAVVDTGVYKNTCISDRLLKGYNILDRNENTVDQSGHGTHVAGIIYDMTKGLNVKILPVKVLDGFSDGERGTASQISAGIHYAVKQGAKVINLSVLIYPENNLPLHSYYLEEEIKEAIRKGVTVVVAAGNASCRVSDVCPADVEEAIVVGSIDEKNKIADYSDYGKPLDLVAPGENIYSTYFNSMGYLSGTSMAAPHISALAAMLKIMYPSYTPSKVEKVLKQNCIDLGPQGWDAKYGYGLPTFHKWKVVAPTAINLDKSSVTMRACETQQLKVKYAPSDTNVKTVTWKSSDKNVVEVVGGKLIAVGKGTATITASSLNGKKAKCSVKVEAAPIMPRNQFSLQSYNPKTKKCVIKTLQYKGATGAQVQIYNCNKKLLATQIGEKKCVFSDIAKQKIYYYRARPYYDIDGIRVYGTWSYRRVFSAAMAKTAANPTGKGIVIRTPKTKGVTEFQICFSTTNKAGSFQKIASVKPGNSFTLKEYKGKALSKYGSGHIFYIVLKPLYPVKECQDAKYIRHQFDLNSVK